MGLSRPEIAALYRRRARRYDLTANLYYLLGFREYAYRRRAIEALSLGPGDTVVELGCGTGLNLPRLREAVGDQGRVIGVDLTDAMLAQAAERVHAAGWSNVELVQSDMTVYHLPTGTDGVISTFALTLVDRYEDVVHRAARQLRPGGRFVVLDFKEPDWAPEWLIRLAVALTAPFGVSRDLGASHPWEAMQRAFSNLDMTELYAGFAYVARSRKARLHHRESDRVSRWPLRSD